MPELIRLTLLLMLPFTVKATSETRILERAQFAKSLDQKLKHNGTNCFSTALFVAGVAETPTNIDSGVHILRDSFYCSQIKYADRRVGDLMTVGGFDYRHAGGIGHAAVLVGRDHVISKNGFKLFHSFTISSLIENAKSYIRDRQCRKMVFQKQTVRDCGDYSEATLYRCDWGRLSQDLALLARKYNSATREIALIRKELFALSLSGGRIDGDSLNARLDSAVSLIEAATQLKKRFELNENQIDARVIHVDKQVSAEDVIALYWWSLADGARNQIRVALE